MLDEFGIRHKQGALGFTLSGGERRRVALAKALAIEGRILLLDEPLDGLDQVTRDAIRMRLRAKLRDRSGPTIIALHDRADAIALADRILLLDSGKSLQVDTPEGLIRSPATIRVAQLFADPSPTILIGRILTIHTIRMRMIRIGYVVLMFSCVGRYFR